jgi:hypothetical protein
MAAANNSTTPIGSSAAVRPARPAKSPRKDRVHIGAYLSPAYKRSIRLLQAATDEDLKAILERILNAEFRLHSVPEVHG